MYTKIGREGHFDGEPDFPLAIESYRQAIEDLYRYNGIDTDSIIRAALDLTS